MPITRTFLDWHKPALAEAVEFLIARYGLSDRLDLSQVVVVLPGARAARRLLEWLVETTGQRQIAFMPGDIITIGQLPELLYPAKRPYANELTQLAAWAEALRSVPREKLVAVIPHPPGADDQLAWLELGDVVRREHVELAADQLNFQDVANEVVKDGIPREVERWQSLSTIQDRYLRLLDGFEMWDRQTARLEAIKRAECHIDRDLVLLGAVDVNRTMRCMLDAVADRVTVLVPAPADWQDRFDAHGCLAPDRWQEVALDFDDQRLHLVDGPTQQAERVARCLAQYGGQYRADEITVGVPDEDVELIAQIERQLAGHQVPARWGPGRSVAESLPYQLLAGIADYVDSGDRDSFASIVRHPDLFDWLARHDLRCPPGSWLGMLDDYLATRFPQRLVAPWLGDDLETQPVAAVYHAVKQLVDPLRAAVRPLPAWSDPIRQLLLEIYGTTEFEMQQPSQRATWRACAAIDAALTSFDAVPAELMPRLSATEAIGLVLRAAGRESVPSPADEPAVELLGWLELPLDDAPALVVTSFNEGKVPKAVNADAFLPNAIRARLGLDDNDRRYARDAYALSVLHASRRELDLIVGQRSSEGDPLAPSRLLLAGDGETVLRRVKLLFSATGPIAEDSPEVAAPRAKGPQRTLTVPRPEQIVEREPSLAGVPGFHSPLTELPVTQFRAYLQCPYRFFLGHVLRLESATDDVRELDPLAFGSLLHDVLRDFGRGSERASLDPKQIGQSLIAQLERIVAARFGPQPLPAVRVQVEQVRHRLLRFAEVQAERAAAGWSIVHVEHDEQSLRVPFDVDGLPITLVGRIDRIDHHAATGRYAVLDYKTSKAGDPPRKTHQRSGEWVDLQLPLYRYLARKLKVDGPIDLGYVLLPSDPARAGFALGNWNEDELTAADEVARHVIRQLRARVYWPPAADFDPRWDEFAGICQSGVMGGPA